MLFPLLAGLADIPHLPIGQDFASYNTVIHVLHEGRAVRAMSEYPLRGVRSMQFGDRRREGTNEVCTEGGLRGGPSPRHPWLGSKLVEGSTTCGVGRYFALMAEARLDDGQEPLRLHVLGPAAALAEAQPLPNSSGYSLGELSVVVRPCSRHSVPPCCC